MKIVKRVLTLALALCLVMGMTAFAGEIETIEPKADGVTAEALPGNVALELEYSKATNGGMYLVLVLSEEGVPTAENILYVNQATADGTTVAFDNIYPMEIPEQASYVYMAGTGLAYSQMAKINPKGSAVVGLKGDVNEDGIVDIVDLQRLFAHLNGSNQLTNLAAGDVNSDGTVDIVDLQRLFAHLNGSNLLN